MFKFTTLFLKILSHLFLDKGYGKIQLLKETFSGFFCRKILKNYFYLEMEPIKIGNPDYYRNL